MPTEPSPQSPPAGEPEPWQPPDYPPLTGKYRVAMRVALIVLACLFGLTFLLIVVAMAVGHAGVS